MKISTAPNLVFRREAVPESWHEHLVSSKNGYTFSQDIKDRILFEFSDVLNGAGPSRMDLVVARDVISFFAQADQKRAFSIFEEALKPQGLVLLGDNEAPLDAESWRRLDKSVSVHRIK